MFGGFFFGPTFRGKQHHFAKVSVSDLYDYIHVIPLKTLHLYENCKSLPSYLSFFLNICHILVSKK